MSKEQILKSLELIEPRHKKNTQEWLFMMCYSIDRLSKKFKLQTPNIGIHGEVEYYNDQIFDGEFKIYHSKGYCIDIKKEYEESISDPPSFSTYESWEGYTEIGDGKWLELLNEVNEELKVRAFEAIQKATKNLQR